MNAFDTKHFLAGLLFCGLVLGVPAMRAQEPESATVPQPTTQPQALPSNPSPHLAPDNSLALENRTDVNWHRLPKNFVQDQKNMWLVYPGQLMRGEHWLPTLVITGTTAGLIASDPHTIQSFRDIGGAQGTDGIIGSKTSGALIAAVPALYYVVALLRHNHYDQATSLFAGEAVVDDTILMIALKAITRRERPLDRPNGGPYTDTFFKSNAGPLGKGSSFPSGHAMMAFSIATVFAQRVGHRHKWVPLVAYAAATAVSFARATTGAHFPSEVFIGAATGFAIARFDVLHGH